VSSARSTRLWRSASGRRGTVPSTGRSPAGRPKGPGTRGRRSARAGRPRRGRRVVSSKSARQRLVGGWRVTNERLGPRHARAVVAARRAPLGKKAKKTRRWQASQAARRLPPASSSKEGRKGAPVSAAWLFGVAGPSRGKRVGGAGVGSSAGAKASPSRQPRSSSSSGPGPRVAGAHVPGEAEGRDAPQPKVRRHAAVPEASGSSGAGRSRRGAPRGRPPARLARRGAAGGVVHPRHGVVHLAPRHQPRPRRRPPAGPREGQRGEKAGAPAPRHPLARRGPRPTGAGRRR